MATSALDPQGIMALPAGGAAENTPQQMPQLGLNDSYDAVQEGLQNASPDAYSAVNAEIAQIIPVLDELEDEELDEAFEGGSVRVQARRSCSTHHPFCQRSLVRG
jgi:hypothetical protein